jgi:hypothetical protein
MSKLNDLENRALRDLIGNSNETAAGLAINLAAAATFKTASAINYTVDGVYRTKPALAAQAFTAGHASVAIGATSYFVVSLNFTGQVFTAQGATIPDVPSNLTPIGIIKVQAVSAVFTPNTTALDAAGLTVTYFDIKSLPSPNTL